MTSGILHASLTDVFSITIIKINWYPVKIRRLCQLSLFRMKVAVLCLGKCAMTWIHNGVPWLICLSSYNLSKENWMLDVPRSNTLVGGIRRPKCSVSLVASCTLNTLLPKENVIFFLRSKNVAKTANCFKTSHDITLWGGSDFGISIILCYAYLFFMESSW